jgi:RNA polymerase I-specific transcription initiation factor RRN3
MKDLQAFFPFDPYRLPDSRKWFDGMYRECGMVALDDDDDEEEDEGEDEEGSEEEEITETSLAEGDGESDDALEVSQRLRDDSSEEEERYGMPMELGSVRERDRDGPGMAESFGQMSISPIPAAIHRQMAKKLGT